MTPEKSYSLPASTIVRFTDRARVWWHWTVTAARGGASGDTRTRAEAAAAVEKAKRRLSR